MKRVLFLIAAVSALGMANAASAQTDRSFLTVDRVQPNVQRVIPRTQIDTSVITERLRTRGVPESNIGITIERIRAALQSGNHPHLLRRLYNAGLIGGDDDPDRRRLFNARNPDETGANRRRHFNARNGDETDVNRRRLQDRAPDSRPVDRTRRTGSDRRGVSDLDPLRGLNFGDLSADRTSRTDSAVRVGRID